MEGRHQSRSCLLINSRRGLPALSWTTAQISYSNPVLSRIFGRRSEREQDGTGESLLRENCGSGWNGVDLVMSYGLLGQSRPDINYFDIMGCMRTIGGALYNPENERFIFAGKIPLNSHKHAIFCKQNEGQGWFKLH